MWLFKHHIFNDVKLGMSLFHFADTVWSVQNEELPGENLTAINLLQSSHRRRVHISIPGIVSTLHVQCLMWISVKTRRPHHRSMCHVRLFNEPKPLVDPMGVPGMRPPPVQFLSLSLADLRGAGTFPPGAQILLTSCSFLEFLAKLYIGAPPGVGAPTWGKSWVHRWLLCSFWPKLCQMLLPPGKSWIRH